MEEEKKDSVKKDTLIDLQFKPVIGEYRGLKLEFHALNAVDTMDFLNMFLENQGIDFVGEKKDEIFKYVALSLKTEKSNIESASVGFLVFALNKLLEAIDFDFFVLDSQALMKKMEMMADSLGLSKEEIAKIEKVSSEKHSSDL